MEKIMTFERKKQGQENMTAWRRKSMGRGKRSLFCAPTNYLNIFLSMTKAQQIMTSISHSISQQPQKLTVNIWGSIPQQCHVQACSVMLSWQPGARSKQPLVPEHTHGSLGSISGAVREPQGRSKAWGALDHCFWVCSVPRLQKCEAS